MSGSALNRAVPVPFCTGPVDVDVTRLRQHDEMVDCKTGERKTHRIGDRLGGSTTRSSWHPLLASVTSIHIRETQVSDNDLKEFDSLPSLTSLELGYTNISDAGVSAPLVPKTQLPIPVGHVTDDSLAVLARMQLFMLNVESTQVSLDGCMELSRKLPECLIYHSRENIIFREAIGRFTAHCLPPFHHALFAETRNEHC